MPNADDDISRPATDTHQESWNTTVNAPKPPVAWNGESYEICLPWPNVPRRQWLEVEVKPKVTYVVRVRELGARQWLAGVETPLTTCTLVELKPNTDYEMEVRAKSVAGESDPAIVTCRTGSDGGLSPHTVTEI